MEEEEMQLQGSEEQTSMERMDVDEEVRLHEDSSVQANNNEQINSSPPQVKHELPIKSEENKLPIQREPREKKDSWKKKEAKEVKQPIPQPHPPPQKPPPLL